MERLARHLGMGGFILATVALTACTGTVTVNLTDTPVDGAASAVVDFTGIELHNTDGKTVTITFPSARQIDLLQLQNGITTALAQGESVPVGDYDWLQLQVLANKDTQGQSYITLNTGAQYPLYIPSGSQAGLRIASPFKVTQGGSTQLLIEFNLRQSVTSTDGQNYTLVPALRMVDQDKAGTVTSGIDLAAITAQQLGSTANVSQCNGALFLFSGSAVKPQNGGGPNLVDFQPIANDGGSTLVSPSIFYVAPGSYTVAVTCNYDQYDPTAAPGGSGYQSLHWTVLDDVSVSANAASTATLPSRTTSNIVN